MLDKKEKLLPESCAAAFLQKIYLTINIEKHCLQGTSWERKTFDHISDTLDRPHYFDVGEQGDRHRNYPACLLFEGGGGCADL